jgi:GAF domain-containing protein
MTAPISANEADRLRVLYQYEILDTISEQAFDELTELASNVCETPIALISLVDEHRQWFKAAVGVNVRETSRDISFCAHAILGTKIFVVPDAARDERFADNPLVTGDPRIRFYAGAPLMAPEGVALGSLCVIDHAPRALTPKQERALEILSRQIVTQLQLRRALENLARLNADIQLVA